MNRTKAFRRHQEWKHKREAIERLKIMIRDYDRWVDGRAIGVFATTPCMFSDNPDRKDELVLDKSEEV